MSLETFWDLKKCKKHHISESVLLRSWQRDDPNCWDLHLPFWSRLFCPARNPGRSPNSHNDEITPFHCTTLCMTPWHMTFYDIMTFKWHEFTLISSPPSRPSTRDESATSLAQWRNPTSSGRYPPSDDWHHPIQRLEPIQTAFVPFTQKNKISKNYEASKHWMIPRFPTALRSDFNMTLVPGFKSLESTKLRSCEALQRIFFSISQFPVDSRVPLAVLHMAFLTVLSTSWRKKMIKVVEKWLNLVWQWNMTNIMK